MANPFDETLKHLVEAEPQAWLRYVGIEAERVEVIDADISTLTTAADKVLKVLDPDPFLVHLEFQSGDPTELGERTLFQDVILRNRHRLPVHSLLILLRKKADRPRVTGIVRYRDPISGTINLEYRYRVVRVWELPVEATLSGSLATLPLAPLTKITRAELPGVIATIKQRLEGEATQTVARELWSATYLLMGLKYPNELTEQLLKGMQGMEDSTTYQAILRKGKAEGKLEGERTGKLDGVREMLLRIGTLRFGTPTPETVTFLDEITSVERLEQLAEGLFRAENWTELLQFQSE